MIFRADTWEECQQVKWDSSWRVAMLVDSEFESMCGKGERGAYTIKMSRRYENWKMRMGDFISYASAENLNAILLLSQKEWEEVHRVYQGHTHNDPFLRPDEPPVLIHSTPLENWKQICSDGCLKSWHRAKADGALREERPIGHVLGDPEDFSNYIMLGTGVNCEIVVASKMAGELLDHADQPYASGARLYFDAQKIAADGLLVRDGNHKKVKNTLPLQPYLIWAATWDRLGLESRITTPALFAAAADDQFSNLKRR